MCGTFPTPTPKPDLLQELSDYRPIEVWVVNEGWMQFSYGDIPPGKERVSRIFELHRPADRPWRSQEHWDLLATTDIPVWTFFPRPQIKTCYTYPVLEVLGQFRPYFTNSFAWMLALALYEGLKEGDEVYLWGAHFLSPAEQVIERGCVEYWLGLCEGRGITVRVDPDSPLLAGGLLYALQDSARAHGELRRQINLWAAQDEYRRQGFSHGG